MSRILHHSFVRSKPDEDGSIRPCQAHVEVAVAVAVVVAVVERLVVRLCAVLTAILANHKR